MSDPKFNGIALTDQLAALFELDRDGLKVRWEAVFETPPPLRASQGFLRLGIAYRLQEVCLGGLTLRIRRRLDKASTALAAGRSDDLQSIR